MTASSGRSTIGKVPIAVLILDFFGKGLGMTDTDQKREDEVLRRMLNTPPTPHKPKEQLPKVVKAKSGKPE